MLEWRFLQEFSSVEQFLIFRPPHSEAMVTYRISKCFKYLREGSMQVILLLLTCNMRGERWENKTDDNPNLEDSEASQRQEGLAVQLWEPVVAKVPEIIFFIKLNIKSVLDHLKEFWRFSQIHDGTLHCIDIDRIQSINTFNKLKILSNFKTVDINGHSLALEQTKLKCESFLQNLQMFSLRKSSLYDFFQSCVGHREGCQVRDSWEYPTGKSRYLKLS